MFLYSSNVYTEIRFDGRLDFLLVVDFPGMSSFPFVTNLRIRSWKSDTFDVLLVSSTAMELKRLGAFLSLTLRVEPTWVAKALFRCSGRLSWERHICSFRNAVDPDRDDVAAKCTKADASFSHAGRKKITANNQVDVTDVIILRLLSVAHETGDI